MAEFTIPDLKRALVEVKEICKSRKFCDNTCPFCNGHDFCLLMVNYPDAWDIDQIKEIDYETD